jgi:hypothetical protein
MPSSTWELSAMRRSVRIVMSVMSALALSAVAGSALSAPGIVAGSPVSADLAASGSVAGGLRVVEAFHPVVFDFTLRNRGPAAVDSSADLGYTTVRNGTVVDQLCILANGSSFNADSPACEFGSLAPGEHARMVLIVQPRTDVSQVYVKVRVCASNESGIPDEVSRNDCTTKRVLIG